MACKCNCKCIQKSIIQFMLLIVPLRISLASSFLLSITKKQGRIIDPSCSFNDHFSRSRFYQQRLKSSDSHDILKDSSGIKSPWTYIQSKKNPTVKLFQTLIQKKKAREQHNLTVIEGYRLVVDVLQSNKHVLPHILVTEDALAHAEFGKILQNLLRLEEEKETSKICLVSNDVLKTCTDTVSPQGIVATIQIPSLDVSSLNKEKIQESNGLYLILDGLSDPGNVGTLLRTCSALGDTVSAIILLHDTVDIYMPKVIRSSMGAIFQVSNIIQSSSFSHVQEMLRGCNVKTVYAATMMTTQQQQSKPYWEMNCESNVALCIGSEAAGLSSEIRDAIEDGIVQAVYIPMSPGTIESLNAAVSGSIIMYEYRRQTSILNKIA